MNNPIRPSEWEALSAYLDNQLSPKDRTHLEARLRGSTELQRALEDLRRTRIILRSQRPMRAPRNFTLSPTMAGVRRAGGRGLGGVYPLLRLASALATIFFIVITVGDLAVQRFAPPPREVSVEEQMQAPAIGMGGGGGGGGGVFEMPVTEIAAAESAREPVGSTEAADAMTLAVTPVGTDDAAAAALKQSGEAPPAPGQPVMNAGALPEEETAPQPPSRPDVLNGLLRSLQVILAVLALAAGLSALYLRRKSA